LTDILGLDIGGANTKACRLTLEASSGASVTHEMWRNPAGLKAVLGGIQARLFREGEPKAVALTMTAELCDVFPSKEEGVVRVLNQVTDIFTGIPVYVWTTESAFAPPERIRKQPLLAAASNWLAGAELVAALLEGRGRQMILLDMGSTTTDILPIAPGKVLALGRSDTRRLALGELVYTGALRTSLAALAGRVYTDGAPCRTANEYFAVTADVYRYLEMICEEEYRVPPPDSAGRDRQDCARRIARLIAADSGSLPEGKIRLICEMIMEKQIGQITEGIWQVLSRFDVTAEELILAGEGAFLLERMAKRMNRKTVSWRELIPQAGTHTDLTPFAAAWLLARKKGV
jgi:probable H4MPT-linked C1 transfer pathway protein